jgi:hypothetical protein
MFALEVGTPAARRDLGDSTVDHENGSLVLLWLCHDIYSRETLMFGVLQQQEYDVVVPGSSELRSSSYGK